YLASLHLRDFRNYAEQRLDLPPQGVALVGDNGQGKTNLLEAIYYLEIFRSIRGAPDEQLVRFGEDTFRIEGRMRSEDGQERSLAAAFDRRRRRKKVTVNGAEPPRLGDAIGGVGAVIFSPSDVALVAGSPGERRRFLDILLSLSEPGYLAALQRFRQTLFQRNALLRQGADTAEVAAWNSGLVEWGSRIVAARLRWVGERAAGFAAHCAHVAGGAPASLEYLCSVRDLPGSEPDAIASAFAAALERGAERETRRGMTLAGPHRDDLRFVLDPGGAAVDLRVYGSGGQQRTAAIALRMTEADTVRERRGRDGLLLLDDVFAELDAGRARRIIEWIEREERGQVILTAPKAGDVELRGGLLERWTVREGRIEPL
ncbi:MAG: DNA replication/repair protein RecF, partial [Gemmatimonadota bacterium]|nr:DNA replication/repair protein RecF [Gemmatimonadota bacterium]